MRMQTKASPQSSAAGARSAAAALATNVAAKAPAPPPAEPVEAARSAGLSYVSDGSPGIARRKSGRDFTYVGPDGKRVRDADTLMRIKSLVIPPAWRDVWICPSPRGHIQAVGRDERGRKQYRYHERWREVRDETKYARMLEFVRALPKIRRRIRRDLRKRGCRARKCWRPSSDCWKPRCIRVGNEEYAKENAHFGLTTIHNRHAEVRGSNIHFHFKGKSGVERVVDLQDQRLARIVRQCQDLPGHELFGYVDEQGNARDVKSEDVNEYLHEIAGGQFTAKDFRTWAGTVLAAQALGNSRRWTRRSSARRTWSPRSTPSPGGWGTPAPFAASATSTRR